MAAYEKALLVPAQVLLAFFFVQSLLMITTAVALLGAVLMHLALHKIEKGTAS